MKKMTDMLNGDEVRADQWNMINLSEGANNTTMINAGNEDG